MQINKLGPTDYPMGYCFDIGVLPDLSILAHQIIHFQNVNSPSSAKITVSICHGHLDSLPYFTKHRPRFRAIKKENIRGGRTSE
jgi:hypothetical protein